MSSDQKEIQEGSVVQLRSGGPTMTVRWVSEELGTWIANCDWFVQDKAPWKKENSSFPLTSLKLLEP
jgi:uncharacterized protein YodC (DUF2158 family)